MQLVTSLNNPRGNLVCRLTDLFGRTYRQRSTFELPEATSFDIFVTCVTAIRFLAELFLQCVGIVCIVHKPLFSKPH